MRIAIHESPLTNLEHFGQSIWLDYIHREMIRSGELHRLIEEDGLSGMTSNPTIFEEAIGHSGVYDQDIAGLVSQGKTAQEVYWALAIQDVQEAADVFRPVYDQTDGRDGFVSLEVSPHLARDTQGTIQEVRRLRTAVQRPNVFIKIPGTPEGIPAIRQCLSEGININITLLFGLPRYLQVVAAYIEALESLERQGRPLERTCSVASFFLSRIDVLVDPVLEQVAQDPPRRQMADASRGHVAICLAKMAYARYKDLFGSQRFRRLAEKGARPQRLLWASTSTKQPEYSDVKYVDALIGPDTINTVPRKTLDAYRDHGNPALRLERDVERANDLLAHLSDLGIDLNQVMLQLEEEGIDKFNRPYDKLFDTLRKKGAK